MPGNGDGDGSSDRDDDGGDDGGVVSESHEVALGLAFRSEKVLMM